MTTSAPPPAEQIAGNEDLLTEILLRLPVKSLLRFESVSKTLLSLITNPKFSLTYTRRRNPKSEPLGLFLSCGKEPECDLLLPLNELVSEADARLSYSNDPGIPVLQECSGLMLCSSSGASHWSNLFSGFFSDPFQRNLYYVWNPTTKQHAVIKMPHEFKGSVLAVNLAFDPLKSPYYKLICVRRVNRNSGTCQLNVYSSETRSWRPPLLFPGKPLGTPFGSPVYCNGAIHWYSGKQTSLYFDVDNECLKTMPTPTPSSGSQDVKYFGASRGRLHLIIHQSSATTFDVLEMESDYSGWFVRYHVNLEQVINAFPDIIWNLDGEFVFSILGVVRAENEEESTIVLFVSGRAISINLHHDTPKVLCDLRPYQKCSGDGLRCHWRDAYQYFETLTRV